MSFIKEKYWDLCAGIFLFLFSIALYYGGMTVRMIEVSRYGSGFFPKMLAILLAVTSLPIIVTGWKKAKAKDAEAETVKKTHWKGIVSTLGLMLVYMLLIPKVGFLIMTFVYLFLQMSILSAAHHKKYWLFALVSIISSATIYLTFVNVFRLMLPAGILG